jgi:hypothetical protein
MITQRRLDEMNAEAEMKVQQWTEEFNDMWIGERQDYADILTANEEEPEDGRYQAEESDTQGEA